MPSRPRFRALAASAFLVATSLAAPALLGACTQRRTACGDPAPEGGGPPVITSRESELCESVRLRVADTLAGLKDHLAPETAERWRDATWQWADAHDVEALVARVREEANDEVASAIHRAAYEVRAHSSKSFRPDCPDQERCLVKGAALGARIAFDDAVFVLRKLRRQYLLEHPEERRPE